jgi:hypothetical protein
MSLPIWRRMADLAGINREYDGSYYTPELKALFEERGADLQSFRVIFNPRILVPSEAASVAH